MIVVDALDEAEPEPGGAGGRGLPLGLPESLPEGVYVVAASRFGIDRALHAVRNPADWLQIEVEGASNLDDMDRFIHDVTSPDGRDARLVAMLRGAGVDAGWFSANVAPACAGVWIYLRYVLDEIRDGTRNPRSVADLPSDLAGFYAEQVERWRGAAEDEAALHRWEQVRLPLLGVLGAARAPMTVAELAGFAQVPSAEAAREFIEEIVRAFLSRDDDLSAVPRYALRHQSLRDLLTGSIPPRPDLQSPARMLAARVQAAHQQITSALIPPGEPGERAWDVAGPYARQHLAAHAAVCGELDTLASDPGFLLAADSGAFLAQRTSVRTLDGKRSLAAFDLSLHAWDAASPTARLDRLAANAARVHAAALTAACSLAGGEWPVRWAAWTGQGHRKLPDHGPVYAVAIGRAGDRDIVVSGYGDGTVRIWDAVTGDPVGAPLARPRLLGDCGGHRAGRELRHHRLRLRGWDGADLGRRHRRSGRRPADRPRPLGDCGGHRAGREPRHHRLRLRGWDGADLGRRHRRSGRRPADRPRPLGDCGGHRAGREPRRHRLRLRRWDGADLGRRHRRSGRRPADRPTPSGVRGGHRARREPRRHRLRLRR